jgi:pimeloyl-ACP methyl ester carboxylesterase
MAPSSPRDAHGSAAAVRGPFPAEPTRIVAAPDGVLIAVFEAGATESSEPPLVLVHGATADHTTFRALAPVLGLRRRVLAVDRRGRGASGDANDYSIELEFEDLAAVANAYATGPGTVDILGHSYGGRCALGASLRTDAIRRVVAYEGAPLPPGASYRPDGLLEKLRADLARGDKEAALSGFLAGIVGMSDEALASYRAEAVWPARVAAAHTILRELEAEVSPAAGLDALGRVTVAVLLIVGGSSRSPFAIGTEALASRLRDATVLEIGGAAHAAHHTHIAEFAAAVEGFLDR